MSKSIEEINRELQEEADKIKQEPEEEPEYNHEKTIEDRWLDNKYESK